MLIFAQGTEEALGVSFYERALNDEEYPTYQVVAMGYNGSLAKISDEDTVLQGGLPTVHAEENAVVFANGPLQNSTMYVTHAPCGGCGRMIVDTGISQVNYLTELEHPHIFEHCILELRQYDSKLLLGLLTKIRNYFESNTSSPEDALVSKKAVESLINAISSPIIHSSTLATYQLLQEPKVKIKYPLNTNREMLENIVVALSENKMANHPFKNYQILDPTPQGQLFEVKLENGAVMLAKVLPSFAVQVLKPFVLMRYQLTNKTLTDIF